MRARDEGALEEQLVGGTLECVSTLGVLVLQPEPQELRGPELHVRRQRVLPAALDGQLGKVAPQAGGPATVEIVLRVGVGAPALDVRLTAASGVDASKAAERL